MKRLIFYAMYVTAQYCVIAGIAWHWVLEMSFPFWKLLVIAVIQAVFSVTAMIIFPRKKETPDE